MPEVLNFCEAGNFRNLQLITVKLFKFAVSGAVQTFVKTTYHLISFGNTNSTEYEEKVPTKEKGRRKMLAMKVAAILLMSTILVQAQPFEKREASAVPFNPFAIETSNATLENEEVTEIVTNPTQIEDSTEPGSLCDDCEVDYKVEDENREEFVQVLDEVSVEDNTSYQPKVIALFSVIGICGIALLGLLVFVLVKMISCLF